MDKQLKKFVITNTVTLSAIGIFTIIFCFKSLEYGVVILVGVALWSAIGSFSYYFTYGKHMSAKAMPYHLQRIYFLSILLLFPIVYIYSAIKIIFLR